MMNVLPLEIIQHHIICHLTFKDILLLMSTCQMLNQHIVISHAISESQITHYEHVHQFKHVIVSWYDPVRWQHLIKMQLDTLITTIDMIWPIRLTHLEMTLYDDSFKISWPVQLKRLIVSYIRQPLYVPWPGTLKYLKIIHYRHDFHHAWPESLRTLKILGFNKTLKYAWPNALTCLKMQSFQHALIRAWPQNLKYLSLWHYNLPIYTPWPTSLKYLFMFMFNAEIYVAWPASLKRLSMNHYQGSLMHLPSSLQYIHCNHCVVNREAWSEQVIIHDTMNPSFDYEEDYYSCEE